MSREIYLVFPKKAGLIKIDYVPSIGEFIEHNIYGKSIVGNIINYVTSVDQNDGNSMRAIYKTTTVTNIILVEI